MGQTFTESHVAPHTKLISSVRRLNAGKFRPKRRNNEVMLMLEHEMEVNVGRIRRTNTTEVMLAQMEVKCDDLIGQLHDAHDLIRSMLPDRE
eukprot:scaffold109808_cov39-Phaeocystis_antarctica.AAC.2